MTVFAIRAEFYSYNESFLGERIVSICRDEANAYLWVSLYKKSLEIENMGGAVMLEIQEWELE